VAHPQLGETWEIRHPRKGVFTARLVAADGEWVELKVVTTARPATLRREVVTGECVSVNRQLTTFVRRVAEL
jgi:hypothetical protein